jgi:FkbM family methyltransferase
MILHWGRGLPGLWRLRHKMLDFSKVRFPELPIKVRLSSGRHLWVKPNDPIGRAIFYDGKWEAPMLDHFAGHLRKGDIVLDVGANIGQFSIVASDLISPQGRIFAVEAGQQACRLLAKSIAENRLANVTLLNFAAWDEDTTLHLGGIREDMLGWGKVQESAGDYTQAVPARRLELALEELGCGHVDVVKVDIEGAELRALLGMNKLFLKSPPRAVYCEVANCHDCYGASPTDLISFFNDRGYHGLVLREEGVKPLDPSLLQQTINLPMVFLRDL